VSDESRHRAAKVYRLVANPGVDRIRSGTERRSSARTPVLAPGPALGSHLCVALSSVQARSVVISRKVSSNSSRNFQSCRATAPPRCVAEYLREQPSVHSGVLEVLCINEKFSRRDLTRSEPRIAFADQKSRSSNLQHVRRGPVLTANDDLVARGQPAVVYQAVA